MMRSPVHGIDRDCPRSNVVYDCARFGKQSAYGGAAVAKAERLAIVQVSILPKLNSARSKLDSPLTEGQYMASNTHHRTRVGFPLT
jgi:hypothetical protein